MAYSQEIADKICERLAAGESLRTASGLGRGLISMLLRIWAGMGTLSSP